MESGLLCGAFDGKRPSIAALASIKAASDSLRKAASDGLRKAASDSPKRSTSDGLKRSTSDGLRKAASDGPKRTSNDGPKRSTSDGQQIASQSAESSSLTTSSPRLSASESDQSAEWSRLPASLRFADEALCPAASELLRCPSQLVERGFEVGRRRGVRDRRAIASTQPRTAAPSHRLQCCFNRSFFFSVCHKHTQLIS